ncbi:uncharacterized protein FA14DRAFT_160937 [Meira miltonrushii]|uniref:SAC domain-containing protein n=1 Tax=Meira miltonrushii TaxID=1280837 RepID=A0A316VEM2_9BASI|nr:uncharacterized protein FA14DRAFT_160937 [Meira miltonrushii]PWN36032.1 hypothetical protein FA14DRAFT_160937 [Meira miltonrushii]
MSAKDENNIDAKEEDVKDSSMTNSQESEHTARLSMNATATDSEAQGSATTAVEQQSRDRSATLETQLGDQDSTQTKTQPGRKDAIGSQVPIESAKGRLSELKRFTLWETKTHFYLVAYNTSQTLFRILKVDRVPGSQSQSSESQDRNSTGSPQNGNESNTTGYKVEDPNGKNAGNPQSSAFWSLNVTADSVVYTRSQISELLDMISEGNKASGGLKEIGRFFGIVGFIRFTCTYYMVLISRRSVVGLLGGHYIYHCDETKIVPVCPAGVLANMSGRTKLLDQEEARLLHMFKQVDLGKNFYFSYTYDLTKTLQDNLTNIDIRTENDSRPLNSQPHTAWGYNEKFVWNHHLLMPAFADSVHSLDNKSAASEWVLPLVYGFVDQAKLRVLNCTIHVTLIARRSRHFAGARFLKRGTDEKGHVANDVETEQIVSDALTTPFYAPSHRRGDGTRGPNPRYTSYVMHRGSIPVFWTQDSTNMSPRPPIEISVVDPFYSSAALHFDDMLRRYGHPIIVLNLIKSKEKQPREVKLLNAFGECVKYLNQFLPNDKRLRYIAWDMSRASKSRDQDVIGVLEDIAEETINATKFFHSGPEPNKFALSFDSKGQHIKARDTILLQSGVARVNCVDCLDRTNAAQFVIGKAAFGHQLYALGLLDHPSLPFDSDAIDMLTEMYHDLGDTIALQYGGSHLVNTMETYRKINQWSSHSRDMLEGLKRYYSNSFVDAEKQAAINLFLGVENDAPEFRPINPKQRRHYQKWYTPSHLEERKDVVAKQMRMQNIVESASNFWAEYYRPSLFTDLMRHHAFKMTAIHQQFASSPMLPKALSPPLIPSSPSSVRSASIATSSPGKPTPSSAGRLQRLQNDSASVISQQTQTTMSPFTSRVPLPSASVAGSPQSKYTPPSPRGSISGQRAIIGGVRRWMSLNRGEEDSNSTHTSSRKVSSKKTELTKTDTKESDGKESSEKPVGMTHILSSASAWPTWDEITGAQIGTTTTEALLDSLMSPNVSAEEVKEYASWLDQFRDVTFESGHNDALTEPSALFPSTALGPSAAGLPNYQFQSLGQRKPATQKQRQQIAEADVRLYDHEVALAAGQIQMAKWNDGIFGTSLESGSTLQPSAHIDLTTADDLEKQQSIEPALLHYPLTKNVLGAPASDAKVRAYTHWLAGHKQSSPIVLSAANS